MMAIESTPVTHATSLASGRRLVAIFAADVAAYSRLMRIKRVMLHIHHPRSDPCSICRTIPTLCPSAVSATKFELEAA